MTFRVPPFFTTWLALLVVGPWLLLGAVVASCFGYEVARCQATVKKAVDDPIAIFTVVLAYFAWLQIIWLGRQEIWSRVHERAYLFPYPRYEKEDETLTENDKTVGRKVRLRVYNYGRNPGRVLSTDW